MRKLFWWPYYIHCKMYYFALYGSNGLTEFCDIRQVGLEIGFCIFSFVWVLSLEIFGYIKAFNSRSHYGGVKIFYSFGIVAVLILTDTLFFLETNGTKNYFLKSPSYFIIYYSSESRRYLFFMLIQYLLQYWIFRYDPNMNYFVFQYGFKYFQGFERLKTFWCHNFKLRCSASLLYFYKFHHWM